MQPTDSHSRKYWKLTGDDPSRGGKPAYCVRFAGRRWELVDPRGVIVSAHPTQQSALDAGKRRAQANRVAIRWQTRDGQLAGGIAFHA